jgi:hypothetical protein
MEARHRATPRKMSDNHSTRNRSYVRKQNLARISRLSVTQCYVGGAMRLGFFFCSNGHRRMNVKSNFRGRQSKESEGAYKFKELMNTNMDIDVMKLNRTFRSCLGNTSK